ncbi:MAG TPA: hypothetical protein VHE79_15725 [Spirochaetia bacterium]
MKRRILAIVLVLVLCAAGAFAEKKSSQIPWWVTHTNPGHMDFTVGAGWTDFGFGVDAGVIYTIGDFDLGPIPLSWGITGLADIGFSWGMGIGAGAFVHLETGWDFGGIWKFDWQAGIGPAIGVGLVPGWSSSGFGFGIGSYESSAWRFSKNMALIGQYAYMWSFFGPGMYAYTLGVEFKL